MALFHRKPNHPRSLVDKIANERRRGIGMSGPTIPVGEAGVQAQQQRRLNQIQFKRQMKEEQTRFLTEDLHSAMAIQKMSEGLRRD